ncbi:MFS general substrate transporter [Myriangium duriaei CBS 260.36]|uniref:MFS general substrate transporter n=1 Tax=Myriangium duriaei CBS 260.36 TaxID=1168546 RepID=A0A9P4IQD8_9PEZI|nr:MFS general substrate transporter [Myriangium duriaei CBS 260.36]
MYFLNAIDRSDLGNAKIDGMDKDMQFKGNEYSLLILFFYIPFGLLDLPLNLLTKRFSGKIMLPTLMLGFGSMALCQPAAKNFGSILVLRLLLASFESGFYCGIVFYLTTFYTRGEIGFRVAIIFGTALLAGAFSGLISFGAFRIPHTNIKGWQWLFIIEGAMTVLVAVVMYFWLPTNPDSAWFLSPEERIAARQRLLQDASSRTNTRLDLRRAFSTFKERRFVVWVILCFTYPVAFATTSNFLPQIVQRLGYSIVKTNLWTVPPNAVGLIILLCVAKSSDYFRERTFHIVFSLVLSLIGMIILVVIDVVTHKGVAFFACFLMAGGAYIPSVLVHSWHNNNDLDESSRAARTGLLIGVGNLAGILSGATFRTEYAPSYWPTLLATSCCNVIAICASIYLGLWMRKENRKRDREQGQRIRAGDLPSEMLQEGEGSAQWRYFV